MHRLRFACTVNAVDILSIEGNTGHQVSPLATTSWDHHFTIAVCCCTGIIAMTWLLYVKARDVRRLLKGVREEHVTNYRSRLKVSLSLSAH